MGTHIYHLSLQTFQVAKLKKKLSKSPASFLNDTHKEIGVRLCIYTIGHPCPCGHRLACFIVSFKVISFKKCLPGPCSCSHVYQLLSIATRAASISGDSKLLGTSFKNPTGLLGRRPKRLWLFFGVSILMDTETLAGFAMPEWASEVDMF